MKRAVLISLVLAFAIAGISQNQTLKSGLKTEKAPWLQVDKQQNQQTNTPPSPEIKIPGDYKDTEVVNIVTLGSSGNAYSMGYAGNKPAMLHYNHDLNTVVFIHRMGGDLDPGGNTGNLGYDISTDGGQTWLLMNLLYTADTAGGYFNPYGASFPQVGIYNPPGNTIPENAFVAFEASLLGGQSNDGIVYGRGNIGDVTDTTRNFLYSYPGQGIYLQEQIAFTLDDNGQIWLINPNTNWGGGGFEWLEELVVTKLIWDETENDFVLEEQILLDCPTTDYWPADIKVAFSPDGDFGYIAAIGNIEEMSGVDSGSYYPIIWRTEDAGETWEGPIKVTLAGEDGIYGVQYYLSDEELAELYDPVPPRDEIPFTTAYDFDLTVDYLGNPVIAVFVGITGEDPFSIITDISQSSGFMFTDAFLLHSTNKGEPGTWIGHEMGRPVSFRGTFGDLTEDNRIQVSRTPTGEQMFVAWLDTDTTVSSENNAPDIWARGIDLIINGKTTNANGENRPDNVTFGSEGTFSSYFFSMGNEVLVSSTDENYFTIPFVYMNMQPTDPSQPILFKYIQDFEMDFGNFFWNVEENKNSVLEEISGPFPNPAKGLMGMQVRVHQSASASLTLTNLMGQTVKQIEAQHLSAGTNKMGLDVSDLQSGIYFITIQAGGEKVSRKLVVE